MIVRIHACSVVARLQSCPLPVLIFANSCLRQRLGVRRYHDASESELERVRTRRRWLKALENTTFTTDHFPISFSRSSGPGGQNVNRLNTKATVRLDMGKCTSAKPAVSQSLDMSPGSRWLLKDVADDLIKESPYYVQSSHTVAISSMRHRTAPANAQDALEKLHEHLMGIGSASLVGETSDEQRRRVKNLQRKESRKMEQVKRKRSDTKAGRGKVSLG